MDDARNAIHATLSAIIGWFALELIAWPGTFAGSKTFDVMARLGTQSQWAMTFWFGASFGLVGLMTRSRAVRLGSVLGVATMHGVIALCFVLANPVNTGTGTYAIIAALGYYLAWRRSREMV